MLVSPLNIFSKVTTKTLIRDQSTPFAQKNKIQSVKTHNRFDYSVHLGTHLTNKSISMPLFWIEGNCDLNGKIISHMDSCHNLLLLLIQFTLYLSIIPLLYCCHSQIFQRHFKPDILCLNMQFRWMCMCVCVCVCARACAHMYMYAHVQFSAV